jgi:hypothetical protein
MKKRGQAAMEYLLVVALILLVFVPTTYIFLSNIQKSSDELSMTKLTRIGNDIVNTAYEVYYQGVPAKIPLKVDMPDGVSNISIINDWSKPANQLLITFRFNDRDEVLVFDSQVNINGSFPNGTFSKGNKNVLISANESADGHHFANIKIT